MIFLHREIATGRVTRRAGNVAFDHVDIGDAEFPRQFGKLFCRFRRYADHQRRFELGVFGNDVLQEIFDTLAGQADRLDDPGLGFRHARRRVAEPRLTADGFRHQRAEPVEIDHVVIFPGKRAGRGLDRILKRQVADFY